MAKTKSLISPNVFHISIDGKRTSFSLDNYLAELLAIRLKGKTENEGSASCHNSISNGEAVCLDSIRSIAPHIETSTAHGDRGDRTALAY